jgi:hypothetical protein
MVTWACRDEEAAVRVFEDREGREWEAFVGRESWGAIVALFSRRRGSEPPRQVLLQVTSPEEGSRLLRRMAEEELIALLERAELHSAGS